MATEETFTDCFSDKQLGVLAIGVVWAEASNLQAEPFNCSDLS